MFVFFDVKNYINLDVIISNNIQSAITALINFYASACEPNKQFSKNQKMDLPKMAKYSTNKNNMQNYEVKVLDLKYQSEVDFLNFKHIYYKMEAKSENDAIKKAKEMYMSGQQGEREEEFPILLKIFSVIN